MNAWPFGKLVCFCTLDFLNVHPAPSLYRQWDKTGCSSPVVVTDVFCPQTIECLFKLVPTA